MNIVYLEKGIVTRRLSQSLFLYLINSFILLFYSSSSAMNEKPISKNYKGYQNSVYD
ncbi:hypothetical protein CU039_0660 [Enterococcus faecium]|nr:hypothetical protein [Enterococcus faecium]MBK4808552.1 hypothetical protein [Enterococcus faecium]